MLFRSEAASNKGKFGFFHEEVEDYKKIADEMGVLCLSDGFQYSSEDGRAEGWVVNVSIS